MNDFDPYKILGLDKNASDSEIKAARRKKSWDNHPDRGGDAQVMSMINRAADILLDDTKRARWDEEKFVESVDEDAGARAVLLGVLTEVLTANMDQDPRTVDMIEVTRHVINSSIKAAANNRARCQTAVDFIAVKLDMIRYTGDRDDVISGLLRQRQEEAMEGVLRHERQIEDHRKALELVNQYRDGMDRLMTDLRTNPHKPIRRGGLADNSYF